MVRAFLLNSDHCWRILSRKTPTITGGIVSLFFENRRQLGRDWEYIQISAVFICRNQQQWFYRSYDMPVSSSDGKSWQYWLIHSFGVSIAIVIVFASGREVFIPLPIIEFVAL